MTSWLAAPGQAELWLQETERDGTVWGLYRPAAFVNEYGVGWSARAGCYFGNAWIRSVGAGNSKKKARRDAARKLCVALWRALEQARRRERRAPERNRPAVEPFDDEWV